MRFYLFFLKEREKEERERVRREGRGLCWMREMAIEYEEGVLYCVLADAFPERRPSVGGDFEKLSEEGVGRAPSSKEGDDEWKDGDLGCGDCDIHQGNEGVGASGQDLEVGTA